MYYRTQRCTKIHTIVIIVQPSSLVLSNKIKFFLIVSQIRRVHLLGPFLFSLFSFIFFFFFFQLPVAMVTQISKSQVEEHNTEDSCWVIVNDKVYDITTFLADHPGGEDILLEFAGTDITNVLGDINYHTHSDAAYDLLTEHYIGNFLKQDDDSVRDLRVKQKIETVKTRSERDEQFLDLRKALFPQLWNATYSKEYYLEQVHRPRYTPYCVPYFDNPVLDKLSKTNWYVVPMIWLPFVCFQLWRSWNSTGASLETATQGFVAGMLFWTLFEYILHRFLFHLDDLLPDHPIALLVHFTLHGIHHHMPMDR